jgi:hypothetical protein
MTCKLSLGIVACNLVYRPRVAEHMAAIPIIIQGTLTYAGLEIGGGPVVGGGTPPSPPLGIWGGAPIPVPTPPIFYPPTPPPGIWGGAPIPVPTPPIYYPPVGGGEPSHPIVIPLPPDTPGAPTHPIVIPPSPGGIPSHPIVIVPPPPAEGTKPPPPEGGWGYSQEHGWGYFPGPSQPGPK